MKNKLKGFISGILITFILLTTTIGYADAIKKKISIYLNMITVTYNDNDVKYNNIYYNKETYITLKDASKLFNKEYNYNSKTKTVTINDKIIPTPVPVPTPTSTPIVQSSFSNPIDIGKTQTIKSDSMFGNNPTYELTVKEILRGEEAWKLVKAENSFNTPPKDINCEYLLVKIHFKLIDIENDAAYSLSPYGIKLVSTNGKVYESLSYAVTPEPSLRTELYKGCEHEGWALYEIAKNDLKPKLAVERNGSGGGGTWFKAYK